MRGQSYQIELWTYPLITPDRGSIMFRPFSLFDSKRWLYLEIGPLPIGLVFIITLVATSLIFFFQELIPIIKHTIESKEPPGIEEGYIPPLKTAVEEIKDELTEIRIIKDEDYILYSTTGRSPTIYINNFSQRYDFRLGESFFF